jgi:hypothetical protein
MEEKFGKFMITWTVVLVLNQILIFSACFKPHCIVAAIPHTFIVALVVTVFLSKKEE